MANSCRDSVFVAVLVPVLVRAFDRVGWNGHDKAAVLHAFEAY
jgi:hypothetical protein